jgi:lipopolysaccharide/colanic/teichoic acid biosynthesis glycosyltransferase
MLGHGGAAKRVIDLLVATPLLLLMLPVLLGCALLVQMFSPGPMLYRQQRSGRDGRVFSLYKLRTMRPDADRRIETLVRDDPVARDEWLRFRRLTRDPRLVPHVGAPLRRTSLDELPQLWNVIRGDMSLVGPRPLELPSVEELPATAIAARARVRPGLTGLWQVSGRSEMTLLEMMAIDEAYVERWSLGLDLTILARTPAAVLLARGAF